MQQILAAVREYRAENNGKFPRMEDLPADVPRRAPLSYWSGDTAARRKGMGPLYNLLISDSVLKRLELYNEKTPFDPSKEPILYISGLGNTETKSVTREYIQAPGKQSCRPLERWSSHPARRNHHLAQPRPPRPLDRLLPRSRPRNLVTPPPPLPAHPQRHRRTPPPTPKSARSVSAMSCPPIPNPSKTRAFSSFSPAPSPSPAPSRPSPSVAVAPAPKPNPSPGSTPSSSTKPKHSLLGRSFRRLPPPHSPRAVPRRAPKPHRHLRRPRRNPRP